MGSYNLGFARTAEAEFRALPFPFRRQINQRFYRLKEDPRPEDAERLSEEERYVLRVGPWAVLYKVDEAAKTVTVMAVMREDRL